MGRVAGLTSAYNFYNNTHSGPARAISLSSFCKLMRVFAKGLAPMRIILSVLLQGELIFIIVFRSVGAASPSLFAYWANSHAYYIIQETGERYTCNFSSFIFPREAAYEAYGRGRILQRGGAGVWVVVSGSLGKLRFVRLHLQCLDKEVHKADEEEGGQSRSASQRKPYLFILARTAGQPVSCLRLSSAGGRRAHGQLQRERHRGTSEPGVRFPDSLSVTPRFRYSIVVARVNGLRGDLLLRSFLQRAWNVLYFEAACAADVFLQCFCGSPRGAGRGLSIKL
jgi:hypothetical protein